ncbi:MAG: MFS transporter [bacterium]|nr:MAG: MFS transporter [bacterium]
MTRDPSPVSGSVSRWRVLALCHLAVFTFAVTLQMIPPLVEALVADLGMTHTQAGALMGLFTFPGIFLAIPGGYLSDVLGPRRVGLISLVTMAAGTFLMVSLTPNLLYAGRFLAGIGGGVLVVVCPQIISQRFLGKELGLAMGIFNTAVPLGTILSFNLLGLTHQVLGMRAVVVITGSLTAVSLASFYLAYVDPSMDPSEEVLPPPTLRGLGPAIWLIAAIWTLFNMAIMSFFTFGIDFFGSYGFTPNLAGLFTSTPMIVSILVVPVVGWLMDRHGWRTGLLIAGGILCGIAILLVFRHPAGAVLWTILLGLGVSMVPPATFSMAGEAVPRRKAGVGFGILTTLFNIGLFLGIPLMGTLRDRAGNYGPSFTLMAVFFLVSAAIALLLGVNRKLLLPPQETG